MEIIHTAVLKYARRTTRCRRYNIINNFHDVKVKPYETVSERDLPDGKSFISNAPAPRGIPPSRIRGTFFISYRDAIDRIVSDSNNTTPYEL